MLSSFVLAALAASFSFVSAANDTVCATGHYASLGCLTSNRGAASLCSKAPHPTITITSTTTTLDVDSITLTKHAQSQVTVQSTETEMATTTITRGPVKLITSTSTKYNTLNTTLTTYVPTAPSGTALFQPFCRPRRALLALGSLEDDTLATACACLGHRLSTSTSTQWVTAKPVPVTSTAIDGTAPTTTIFHIVRHTKTLTVRPEKTMTKHKTACTTATLTETYAAPTFTQVYGPKAGCADTAAGSPVALDPSITNMWKATDECKAICQQDANCEFVYVQKLFSESNGKPYFGCTMNAQHLDEEKDLDCKRKAGVYGVAVGYDAYDRGTEPL
ncbi:uncharacterized protein LTR77_008138 [Saxophila tyrrhenica]|uniref:Apple domain-containing protein n=1 Tax=Saxophila tyrrhenica TaxID=1690608 RepID=A0AAV9P1W3_9PEZI|nr:hypothetical protein LTR77_008138 [Saxophila tyrrhenica]